MRTLNFPGGFLAGVDDFAGFSSSLLSESEPELESDEELDDSAGFLPLLPRRPPDPWVEVFFLGELLSLKPPAFEPDLDLDPDLLELNPPSLYEPL